jgi:thiamine transporter
MGGSITLFSMLFIVLIGYWYGLGSGIMAAVAYGLLQMIVDPYIVSIPQMLCDYIFAFGALGLSGVFHNAKHGLIKGYLLGIFGRFVFSFLSGLIFFGQYAPDGMNPAVYSAAYNGSYIAAEGAVTIILLMIPAVSNALSKIKKLATQNETAAPDRRNASTTD